MKKQLRTSLFARRKLISESEPQAVFVAVVRSIPPWLDFVVQYEPELAPSRLVMLKGRFVHEYGEAYQLQLDLMLRSGRLKKLVDRLPWNAILLAHHADPARSHRQILLRYLIANCDCQGHEWESPQALKLRYGPNPRARTERE